jgi:hypothetical protein
MKAIKILMVI